MCTSSMIASSNSVEVVCTKTHCMDKYSIIHSYFQGPFIVSLTRFSDKLFM